MENKEIIRFHFSRYIKFIIIEKIRIFLQWTFITFIIINFLHINYLEFFSSYQLFLLSILLFIVISQQFIKLWANRKYILSAIKENKKSSLIVTDSKISYSPPYSGENFHSLLSKITFEEIETSGESTTTYSYFITTKNKRIELDDTIGIDMKLLKETLQIRGKANVKEDLIIS